jgi:hypothetical protein
MSTTEPPQSSEPAPVRERSKWSVGRVVGMVFASLGGLIGLALLLGGIAVIAAYAFGRDDDGYLTSDREHLESTTLDRRMASGARMNRRRRGFFEHTSA